MGGKTFPIEDMCESRKPDRHHCVITMEPLTQDAIAVDWDYF